MVTAVCYATIGLFWSSVMRTTLAATVMAQGSVIMLLLAVPFLFVIISLLLDAFSGDPGRFFIYGMGLLLSAHPFIALGLSATFLSEGEGPLLVNVPYAQGDLLLPSPWLVYVGISAVLTLICLFLAVRMLQPGRDERPAWFQRKRKGEQKQGSAAEG
jgi:ABC-2 type transport system permease protein